MRDRLTEHARGVLALAQDEAQRLEHAFIGTEHILLGLIRERDGLAAKAIESFEISLDVARGIVKEIVRLRAEANADGPPFTPRAKKALECAWRESLGSGQNSIGTEHMLLGTIRDPDCGAIRLLERLGIDPSRLREKLLDLMSISDADDNWTAGEGSSARCARCDERLDRNLRFRRVVALSIDNADRLEATVIFCGRCGTCLSANPIRP